MSPFPAVSAPAAEAPIADLPRFVVGQDPQGRWVALESRGLAGGIFRNRSDAIHYAVGETRHRPDAVVLSGERIALRL